MKITAVVVTYNRLELLKHGIECLKSQQKLNDIIIVDNGATDGTHQYLDQLTNQESDNHSQVKTPVTVIHQENVGGSGGFYTGIKAAFEHGADWIWCMDDDVFPQEDCLEHLLNEVDKPDVGILAPRRMLDGHVFTHEFSRFNFDNPFASLHGDKLAKRDIRSTTEIVGCDFEGPFINRKVVEKIGLPNKDLFIFCDDTDYCLRAHLAGFKLYYVPQALMDKHLFFSNDNWTTRNQKKKWKRYYQVRNEAYLNHHYGLNWGVRHLRSFIGVLGYYIPALLSMPFTNAWSMTDLKTLWKAYKDGINERLGKRM